MGARDTRGGYIVLLAVVVAGLFFVGGNAHALVLGETPLDTLSWESISVQGTDNPSCQSIGYAPFDGYTEVGNYTLLSLPISIYPLGEQDANVTIFINQGDVPRHIIHANDILSGGMIHVIIAPENQIIPTTLITVCANPSEGTNEIVVGKQGYIGLYQQPYFEEEGSFQTIVGGSHPNLGEEIPVLVTVTNTGSESADIKIDYREYDLDYIPLLKGETGFEGTILAGETKTITYFIKPLRGVSLLLPPAVLTYTNIFGEPITLESTRAYLNVNAPEFNVKGAFLVPKTQVPINKSIDVRWVVQNEGLLPVQGVKASFFITPFVEIEPTEVIIPELTPASAEGKTFTLTFTDPGTYEIGCSIFSQYDENITAGCLTATIEVVDPANGIALLFSILLLLIAVGVYAYIYLLPNRTPTEEPRPRKRFQY